MPAPARGRPKLASGSSATCSSTPSAKRHRQPSSVMPCSTWANLVAVGASWTSAARRVAATRSHLCQLEQRAPSVRHRLHQPDGAMPATSTGIRPRPEGPACAPRRTARRARHRRLPARCRTAAGDATRGCGLPNRKRSAGMVLARNDVPSSSCRKGLDKVPRRPVGYAKVSGARMAPAQPPRDGAPDMPQRVTWHGVEQRPKPAVALRERLRHDGRIQGHW